MTFFFFSRNRKGNLTGYYGGYCNPSQIPKAHNSACPPLVLREATTTAHQLPGPYSIIEPVTKKDDSKESETERIQKRFYLSTMLQDGQFVVLRNKY